MRLLAASFALLLATVVTSSNAMACAVRRSSAALVERGYADMTISSVAIVRVYAAGDIPSSRGRAQFRVESKNVLTAWGLDAPEQVYFYHGLSTCDLPYSTPRAGDLWLAYFRTLQDGTLGVWKAMPLSVARTADRRLGPALANWNDQSAT